MARKTIQRELVEANLSPQQMEAAIPKIDRRIADVEAFDVQSVSHRSDPRIRALEHELDALLVAIFGTGTTEYARYKGTVTHLDRAGISLGGPTPINEVRDGLRLGVASAKVQLESIKKGFLEELDDSGLTTEGTALKAYEGLELHPKIEYAAGQLYRNGHYANAVEDAVKALNGLVRLNSGVDDIDGIALMEHVFSPKNPILKFNDLTDEPARNEQKGFMMMFSGAVAGLRNPRAHKIIVDDAERALEFIAFISLLAKLADKARR